MKRLNITTSGGKTSIKVVGIFRLTDVGVFKLNELSN